MIVAIPEPLTEVADQRLVAWLDDPARLDLERVVESRIAQLLLSAGKKRLASQDGSPMSDSAREEMAEAVGLNSFLGVLRELANQKHHEVIRFSE